jgi:hypothetical protein
MKFIDQNFGRLGNRLFQLFFIYGQWRDGNIKDIFLQDCRYFDKYRPELMKMAFGNLVSDYDERISIHIRRGKNPSVPEEPKYSENPFYVDLMRTHYYEEAQLLFPGKQFLIFSDDLEFVKKGFIGKQYDFFEGDEQESFNAMAKCIGHIIANSSFSYMAAYLGGGKTIAPKAWFSDGVQRVGFPSDWTLV